jgi:hypothetical protein
MTISDLIEALSKYPQDLEVAYYGDATDSWVKTINLEHSNYGDWILLS